MLYENYIDRMKNYHDLKESIGIDVVNLSVKSQSDTWKRGCGHGRSTRHILKR